MSVKIYSTNTCPWCTKAKEFFKQNNIKFEDINVSVDKKRLDEMIEKSGQVGVPVIDINGKIIVGFNEKAITESLAA